MANTNRLLGTCLNGHVFAITEGTELEQKAKKRIENGFLSAICVQSHECPLCQEDKRIENSRHVEYGIDLSWGD